jgi:hypothetical protein
MGQEMSKTFYTNYLEKLQERDSPIKMTFSRIAGPKIWIRNRNKLKIRSPYVSQLCMAIADFMQLNEQYKEN